MGAAKAPIRGQVGGAGQGSARGGECLPSTWHVVELSSPTGAWRSHWRSHSFCAHRWHLGYTHPWFRCHQSHRNVVSALIRTHTTPWCGINATAYFLCNIHSAYLSRTIQRAESLAHTPLLDPSYTTSHHHRSSQDA